MGDEGGDGGGANSPANPDSEPWPEKRLKLNDESMSRQLPVTPWKVHLHHRVRTTARQQAWLAA